MSQLKLLNLIPQETETVLEFKAIDDDFIEFIKQIQDLQDDYIKFYIYNNRNASKRLRKKLIELQRYIATMRVNVLEVREERAKNGYDKHAAIKLFNKK